MTGPTYVRYDAERARAHRDSVQELYELAYTDFIASGNEFDSVEAFMDRFDAYSRNPSLDLVIAWKGGQPVGQAWGWPLSATSGWWSGIRHAPDAGFTEEDGNRTFGLSEIMVAKECTGQGIAHRLHDELLSGRPERRATLLAESDNDPAYRAYLRWGWKRAAELDPGWPGAPVFDVLVLDLERARPLMRYANPSNAG